MNIFDGLKAFAKKKEQEEDDDKGFSEIDNTGRNSKGVYINEYTCQTYDDRCYSTADYYEDALEDTPDAEYNID